MEPVFHRTVLGLDIGQHSAKVVRLVRRGNGTIRVTHRDMVRIPAGMGTAEQSVLIARWMSQQGFRGEPCVLSVRGLNVLFQTLALASDDPRPADLAVELEIARLSEIATETMRHGFMEIAAGEDKGRRFLIGLTRAEAVEQVLALARGAGADVVEMVPSPVAAALTVGAMEKAGGCLAVADIGMGGTDLAVVGPEGIRFARSFAVGGQSFTEALARAKRMTATQAEPVKIASGLEGADKEVLTAAAEHWVSEFKACLGIYRSYFPGPSDQPVELILTGGGALMRGLERYLAWKLGLETRLLKALPGMSERGEEAALYGVACGLALAGAGAVGKGYVSLLPSEIRETLLLRRQKRYWVAAAILIVLTAAANLLGSYRDQQRKMAEIRAQHESWSRRQALQREIEGIQHLNQRLDRMMGTVHTLLQNGPAFRDVVSALAERLETNCWITLVADANSYFAQENLVKPEARRAPRGIAPHERKEGEPAVLQGEMRFSRVIVEGYTTDTSFASVQKLIDSLKAAGFIQKADLLGDDQLIEEDTAKWGLAGGKRFVIDLTL